MEKEHLNAVHDELRAVEPFPAVFDPGYVARINATHKKEYGSLREAAEGVREDIRSFKSQHGLQRAVMVNCASTEAYAQPQKAHFDLDEFEKALDRSDASISPAMVYAYAALKEGVPYANGAPSLAADIRLPSALSTAWPFSMTSACNSFLGLKYGSCHRLRRNPCSRRSEIIFLGSPNLVGENSKSQRKGVSGQPTSKWTTSHGTGVALVRWTP